MSSVTVKRYFLRYSCFLVSSRFGFLPQRPSWYSNLSWKVASETGTFKAFAITYCAH